MHQRQPFEPAIVVEARDMQHAVVQQVAVGGAVGRVPGTGGDELVDILEPFVVALVGDDAAVGIDGDGRPSCLKRPSAVRFTGTDRGS